VPRPTFDLESFSCAGFCWTGPSEKYPLGRWVPPPGAKQPGIAAVGSAAYAEHPTTELLCASYDLDDGLGVRRWLPGQPMPLDLRVHLEDGGTLEFHKADFEVGMWAAQLVAKHGWMPLPAGAARCSMAKAHVAQYPGTLGNLGAVLGIETEKDKDGKRLINKFCIPQQPIPGLTDKRTGKVKREPVPARRIYPHDDPEDFERLCSYCDTDVIAQMQASDAMPDMEPHEVVAWQLDQQMNHRGLAIDREGMAACIDILGQVLEQYGDECERITGLKATQLEKLKGWLAAYGVHTASLDADAITALLARDNLPPPARRVLELRALTGSASVKKLYQMANQVSADGRLRHLVIHHGTRPGRPTGTGPQPLNLPKAGPQLVWCDCGRPHKPAAVICPWCGEIGAPSRKPAWKPAMVDHVLEIMACGSLAMVEAYFGDAMLCISGCLRGLFVAGDGYELVSTDYSSLQAVVAACLAGEQWKVEAFRDRRPVYLLSASSITGTSVEQYEAYAAEHGTHHQDRQAGKTAELACLSPETQVLTDRGYMPITAVTVDDKLWDGEEWVTHLGLIDKGVRTVVSLDGVRMTPDHLVRWGLSWQPASLLVSSESMRRQALAIGSANLPLSVWPRQRASKCNVPAGLSRIESLKATYALVSQRAARLARVKRPAWLVNVSGGTLISSRMRYTGVDCSTASLLVSHDASLARPKKRTQTTAGAAFECLSLGRAVSKAVELSYPTSSLCRVGTYLRSTWIASELTATMNRAICALSPARRIMRTVGPSKTCKPSSLSTSRVYDIAHAGPRNRFTIKTDSGHLIVHNCGFQGWIGAWRAMEEQQGVDSGYDDKKVRDIIVAWRDANPAIVEMWGGQWRGPPWRRERHELFGLEGMFIAAVQNPGRAFTYRGVTFCMEDGLDTLVIRLPQIDGIRRPLRYHSPRLTASERNADELSISYMTENSNAKYGGTGWTRMGTWGGRLFENVVMGVEVDIQRYGVKLLARHGYPMVLGVYDEDCVEIPKGKPLTLGLPPIDGLDPYVQEIEHLLSILPPEINDWPIRAADGWRGHRYRK
jgi:hypothetical protein